MLAEMMKTAVNLKTIKKLLKLRGYIVVKLVLSDKWGRFGPRVPIVQSPGARLNIKRLHHV
jgi:hypothetical protein